MSALTDTIRSWTESAPLDTVKRLLEAALFRSAEPQPVSAWRMIIDPPMPYWVTLFSQTCRIISVLILLPIFLIGVLDFAGYAVFRTLGLHRRRVRIQRQTKAGFKPYSQPYSRRKPHVYHNDRHRPTDRSNIPSIVKAPLLSPGTYDAETLLRQRARSLSSASVEEEAAWVASGGQQARLSKITKDGEPLLTSTDSDGGSQADTDTQRDYFGRAPRVGVDGALGLADTDVEESGTESGRDSPVQRFSQFKSPASGNNRRRGLSGGLNFTPVSQDKPARPLQPAAVDTNTTAANDTDTISAHDNGSPHHHDAESYTASVVSLSSNSPTSSLNGDRFLAPANINTTTTTTKSVGGNSNDDASSSNLSSSWIGIETTEEPLRLPVTLDPAAAAEAAGVQE